MPKPSSSKNNNRIIWLIAERDKKVYIFPKRISPKVNLIPWLKIELAYYDITIQHDSHNARGTPTSVLNLKYISKQNYVIIFTET